MKRVGKLIGMGVCIGILLGMVRAALRIDGEAFMQWYWIAGAAFVLCAVLFNALYIGRYRKRMRKAFSYFEKGETQAYMDEIEDMLLYTRDRNLRNTLKIDLSVGYYEMGEYERAVSILEEMADKPMRGGVKLVYRLNLCLYYFRTSRNGRAMELYHAGEKEFARYRESGYYSGSIALLDMLAAIEDGRYAEAEALLAHARQRWNVPRMQKEYQMIEDRLAARK